MIGLTPQQKKHFDKVISFLTISLLGVFAFTVALFLLSEISGAPTRKVYEPDIVQKGNYISERDIAIEKSKLPVFAEFPDDFSTSTPTLNDVFDSVAQPVTQSEYLNLTNQTQPVVFPSDYANTETFQAAQVVNPTNIESTPSLVYIDPSSNITLESVEVEYGSVLKNEQPTMQSRQGIVFDIDRDKGILLLSSVNGGTQRIFVEPTTQFLINGKPIAFANLTETDIVYVEGLGFNGVSEINASTVAIIGRFEIITKTDT